MSGGFCVCRNYIQIAEQNFDILQYCRTLKKSISTTEMWWKFEHSCISQRPSPWLLQQLWTAWTMKLQWRGREPVGTCPGLFWYRTIGYWCGFIGAVGNLPGVRQGSQPVWTFFKNMESVFWLLDVWYFTIGLLVRRHWCCWEHARTETRQSTGLVIF